MNKRRPFMAALCLTALVLVGARMSLAQEHENGALRSKEQATGIRVSRREADEQEKLKRELQRIDEQLRPFDEEEARIQEGLDQNKAKILTHNANPPDETNEAAVHAYNVEAERLESQRTELKAQLRDVAGRRAELAVRRGQALSRMRLIWLRDRNAQLDKDIADLDARVRRTRALLERLKNDSLNDVAQIEAAAREFQEADREVVIEVVGLAVKMMTEARLVSKALYGIKLNRYPGEQWKGFREAVMEARRSFDVFNTKEAQVMLKEMYYAGAVLGKAPGAVTSGEADKALSGASKAMQWMAVEMGYQTKAGQRILDRVPVLERLEERRSKGDRRIYWEDWEALLACASLHYPVYAPVPFTLLRGFDRDCQPARRPGRRFGRRRFCQTGWAGSRACGRASPP